MDERRQSHKTDVYHIYETIDDHISVLNPYLCHCTSYEIQSPAMTKYAPYVPIIKSRFLLQSQDIGKIYCMHMALKTYNKTVSS